VCAATNSNSSDTYQWLKNGVVVQTGTGLVGSIYNCKIDNLNTYSGIIPQITLNQTPSSGTLSSTTQQLNIPSGIYITKLNPAGTLIQNNVSALITNILSPTSLPSTPFDIYVLGELRVDVNLTIEHATINMGNATTIRILQANSPKLTLNEVNLKAGCGFLWNGILMNAGSITDHPGLDMTDCIIEDAVTAIRANKLVDLAVKTTEFRKNHIGILYPNVSSAPNTLLINGCIFTCDGLTLLPASSAAVPVGWPSITSRSYCGQFIISATNWNSNNAIQNQYRSMECGIVSRRVGHLVVSNSLFHNITNSAATYTNPNYTANGAPIEGIGVFCDANENNPGDCTSEINSSNFNNCSWGIQVARLRQTYIWNNYFGDSDNGISVRSPSAGTNAFVEVTNNTIFASNRGILCLDFQDMGTQTLGFLINGNQLHKGSQSQILTNYVDGFLAYEGDATVNLLGGEISNNQIWLYGSGLAFKVLGADHVKVANNIINQNQSHLGSNGLPQGNRGYKFEDNRKLFIQKNQAIGVDLDWNLPIGYFNNVSSFLFVDNLNTLILCNSSMNSQQGFRFDGWVGHSNTFFYGNELETHRNGVLVGIPIGNQNHTGNTWCGTGFHTALTSETFANAAGSQFTINSDGAPNNGCNFVPPNNTYFGSLFFNNSTSNYDNYASVTSILDSATEQILLEGELAFLPEIIEPAMAWEKKREIYRTLQLNQSLLNGSTILYQFFQDYANTDLVDFSIVKTALIASGQNPIQENVVLLNLFVQKDGLLSQIDDILQSEFEGQELIDANAQLILLQNQLNAVQAALDIELNQVTVQQAALANEVLILNNVLAEDADYKYVEKLVNEVELGFIGRARGYLTTPERILLELVAELCPKQYGKSVKRARTLMLHVDPALSYDEDFDCTGTQNSQMLMIKQQQTPTGKATLIAYPVPATNSCTLSFTCYAPNATLQVIDVMGNQIQSIQLNNTNGTEVIDISSLPTGIYFCLLKHGKEVLAQQRILVTR
jgi:Secretion system C-terminal sorting domain